LDSNTDLAVGEPKRSWEVGEPSSGPFVERVDWGIEPVTEVTHREEVGGFGGSLDGHVRDSAELSGCGNQRQYMTPLDAVAADG